MKRIKLKKRKQHLTKFNKIIIILILIITLSLFSIKKLGELINDKIMDFAIIEVNKLSRNIINKAVNETVLKELETDKLFIIEKNSKGDIQLIDFDALYVNKTMTQSYGINNSVITVYVNIKVNEQVLLPLSTKRNTVSNDIPIAIKVIQGNIPNYYFNGVESNSSLYNMPTN